MAKESGWLATSKKTYGNCSGGGGKAMPKGSTAKGSTAGMGKKDGGKSGATPFGNSSGGGKGPKGKAHAQNNPTGIGYGGVDKKAYGRKKG